jgi:hypothetical protein
MAGGQVGGNGSIYWEMNHTTDTTKKRPEPVRVRHGCVEAHDQDVTVSQINATSVYPNLKKFPKKGNFLVRLRFKGKKRDAIEKWINSAPASVRHQFTTYLSRGVRIVAINVKGIHRKKPESGKSWESMPWEIRFDW